MRRLLAMTCLCASGCLSDASAPSAVSSLQVYSNASPNGVFVGDQVQLNASPLDLNGNVVPISVTFASSNASVATVNASGLITATGPGTCTIGVSAGGQTANFTLKVDGNVTASVQVAPPTFTVAPGQQLQLASNVLTTLGNPARGKSATWSTSDATKVTVSTTGLITAVAPTAGVSVCAAASDNAAIKGCATAIVQPPASSVAGHAERVGP